MPVRRKAKRKGSQKDSAVEGKKSGLENKDTGQAVNRAVRKTGEYRQKTAAGKIRNYLPYTTLRARYGRQWTKKILEVGI